VRPGTPVLSVSGDGGFLFSAQELETAARLGVSFTHVIFNDSTYDMVAFQQQMKYQRTSGIQLGGYDVVKYTESFGGHGYRVHSLDELETTLKKALAEPGASVIDVPVDYSENLQRLAGQLQEGVLS
jgi:acetolactate synthase-1/2/3 large subunit